MPVGLFCDTRVKPLAQKYSVFPKCKSALYSQPSCPIGGALANVTNAGQDAVDVDGALRREHLKRTEKTCGPDTSTLVSSSRQGARATVAKKPAAPGRARSNR